MTAINIEQDLARWMLRRCFIIKSRKATMRDVIRYLGKDISSDNMTRLRLLVRSANRIITGRGYDVDFNNFHLSEYLSLIKNGKHQRVALRKFRAQRVSTSTIIPAAGKTHSFIKGSRDAMAKDARAIIDEHFGSQVSVPGSLPMHSLNQGINPEIPKFDELPEHLEEGEAFVYEDRLYRRILGGYKVIDTKAANPDAYYFK